MRSLASIGTVILATLAAPAPALGQEGPDVLDPEVLWSYDTEG